MKKSNQKGITLIALIVSIIVMLILVYVTINLVYDGQLVEKAGDAKDLTKAKADEEKEMDNEAEWKVFEAIINPEKFEYNKTYEKIYINPKPPKLSQLNPEVYNLQTDEDGDNIHFPCDPEEGWADSWINKNYTDWNISPKTFISQEIEPENLEEFEYWFKPSLNKTYKYINDSWTEQNIYIALTEGDIPTNSKKGDLAIYFGMGDPLLIEYQEMPELFVIFMNNKMYAYIQEEKDINFYNTMFGDIGMEKGWNILTNNDEDPFPDISEHINYSKDIFCINNVKFLGDEYNNFDELNEYLGYYYRSTPW